MYEWFEKRRSDAMLLPLLEGDEDDREDRSGFASASASSAASALKRHSSVGSAASSSRRRLRAEHERRLLRLLKDSCITTGSEVTDYEYGAHPHLPSSGSIDVYGVDDDDDDVNGDNDNDVDVGDYEGDVYHAPARKMKWTDVLRLSAVVVVTAAGISSYIAAIVQSLLVSAVTATTTTAATAASEWSLGVAGITCLLTSTLVWRTEIRLNHVVSLRAGLRGLRHLARRLARELKTLAREKEALIAEVERLKQIGILLEHIVKERNGGNVDDFVKLVRENQTILRDMKENIRQSVLQDVVRLVLKSDADRDGYINKKEADVLGKRLSISMEVYGIVFDIQKFHRAVGLTASIYGVLTIVRHLLPDENDRQSTLNSMDSIVSDAEFFYRAGKEDGKGGLEMENEEEGEDDVYDMFYLPVEEDFHRGDARAIHLCKEYCAKNGELPKLISISPARRDSLVGLRCSVSGVGDC